MSGRRAIGLMALGLVVFWSIVLAYTFSQSWRQTEHLLSGGLRGARGVVWAREETVVVSEVGQPGTGGRLSWVSTEGNSRGTLLDGLPARADAAELIGAAGIAVAPQNGLLLVTGPCGAPLCSSLLRRDESTRVSTVARLSDAPSSRPWGVALGTDGAAYVSDAGTGALLKIPAAATATDASAVPLAQLGGDAIPAGVSPAPEGGVYVALIGRGQVVRVAPDGAVTTVLDGLTLPVAVARELDGHLLVLEMAARRADGADEPSSGRLLRVDLVSPTNREIVSSRLDRPNALALSPEGFAFVTTGGGLGHGSAGEGLVLQIRRVGPRPPPRSYFQFR
jgi:sugar lactone lactonase YvrE